MDLTFTEEQEILRDTARRFTANEISVDFIRKFVDHEARFDDEKWSRLASLGWNGILMPEEYGGLDLSFVDLAVVLEELGKAPMPGPFTSTVVLAGETIRLAANRKQKEAFLPKIASGELKATLAWAEPECLYDLNRIRTDLLENGQSLVINGAKLFVNDADVADFIICVAKGRYGNCLIMVEHDAPGVQIRRRETMDRTTSLCEVAFQDVAVSRDLILNGDLNTAAVLRQVFNRVNVAYAVDMVGGSERALFIGVEYAKIRSQFNQPIGSFQAIKHRCADLLTGVEGARSLSYYAAWAQDQGLHEAATSASAAKAFAAEVYAHTTKEVLQILGAIGFSWESELHIYLKRAKCLGALFGDPTFHRDRLAQMLGY